MIIGLLNPILIEVDVDCSFDEFILNWSCQCPHWYYFTNAGINWLKKTKGIKYKRECDEIL